MAFTASKLNNIAGSMGLSNFWIYTDRDNTLTTIDADNWFAGANDYNMRVGDSVLLVGSNGCALGSMTTLTDTTSVLTALVAIGA